MEASIPDGKGSSLIKKLMSVPSSFQPLTVSSFSSTYVCSSLQNKQMDQEKETEEEELCDEVIHKKSKKQI